MSRAEEREEADCVCSVGMKLTWDINDPKLPQVPRDPSHPLLILNVINKKNWEEIRRKLKLGRQWTESGEAGSQGRRRLFISDHSLIRSEHKRGKKKQTEKAKHENKIKVRCF